MSRHTQHVSPCRLTLGKQFDPITGGKTNHVQWKNSATYKGIKKIISAYRKETKNDGSRKLIQRIKEIYVGITEKDIDAERKNDSQTQQMKPQFKNKPPLKPIQADCPMAINQVDIVNPSGFPSTYKGLVNKYVLSVIDVFSRFLWLTPLPSIDSTMVVEALYTIYLQQGPPKVLQCDQESEFKGIVKILMNKLGSRISNSKAYQPQSHLFIY